MSIMGSIYTNPSELNDENIDWKERAETYLYDQELFRKENIELREQLRETDKSNWELREKLNIAIEALEYAKIYVNGYRIFDALARIKDIK